MPTVVCLHDLLARTARIRPAAPALTSRGRTVGYGELWDEARAAATLLERTGVGRGDRVAVYLEKRIETVVTILAASITGALVVPVNHVLKRAQVGHILRDSGARVLVTSAERLGVLGTEPADTDIADVILVDGTDAGGAQAGDGVRVQPWRTDLPPAEPVALTDLDPAMILYTSGSTGAPKGVVLSHRNLVAGAESVSGYLGNTADDVILSILPLSFDAGLSQVTTAFAAGAHCVLMNYLLPRDVPKLCEQHGVTGITGVPPLWRQLVSVEWPAATAARLRYWANTGGRMPRATLEHLRRTFPVAAPFLMYGLTEAFRSTYLDPAQIDRRPDSIGRPIPNAEVLVLDPEGRPCPAGVPGELVHRGPLVALGYWNDVARTAERFRDLAHRGQPWRAPERAVWSGDTVVADEEGYLTFVARADEMIKTSGYRVSPTEVEEAAYTTGLVRDAVVFGVEDDALGQRIVLVAAGSKGALDVAALAAALRTALPAYMVPSQIVEREELPRSPNGKYDRVLIRAEVRA